MLLEWRQKHPIDLTLQWRGSNIYGDQWVDRVIGTNIDSISQVDQIVAVISGPQGQSAPKRIASLQFVLDGGGAPLQIGQEVELPDVPFNCTITGWTLTADQVGSVQLTVSRSSFAGYPAFAEISGLEKPILTSAQKSQDTSLSTWSVGLSQGDVIKAQVDSADTIERLYISLRIQEN